MCNEKENKRTVYNYRLDTCTHIFYIHLIHENKYPFLMNNNMKNFKHDIQEIWKVVIVFLVVFGFVMLLGWFIKLLFN